jgi:hypothetical protein
MAPAMQPPPPSPPPELPPTPSFASDRPSSGSSSKRSKDSSRSRYWSTVMTFWPSGSASARLAPDPQSSVHHSSVLHPETQPPPPPAPPPPPPPPPALPPIQPSLLSRPPQDGSSKSGNPNYPSPSQPTSRLGSSWFPPGSSLPRGGPSRSGHAGSSSGSRAALGGGYAGPMGMLRPSASHRVQCRICFLFFTHRTIMRTHVQVAHNSKETWPCRYPQCTKVFGHRSSRSRHENAHTKWPEEHSFQ